MKEIDLLKSIISNSNNIVFFGGAGVSTLSGIKDFRSKNGLYSQNNGNNVEYYLSSSCFYDEPEEFYKFYKENMNCLDIKPNKIHYYLTELEKSKKLKAIITQNIDGLHQKSGSKNVIELHGSVYRNYCLKCNKKYKADYVFNGCGVPICNCGGVIKPNVVLYGELLPPSYELAISYIHNADTLVVAGTSLTVEPACSLVKFFNGKNLVIINNDRTKYDNIATLVIHEDLGKVIDYLK